ncbi:MAG: DcaP family trimeric outer membrane transporter [Candidatus Brevundimonas colombiensis]|uniref:DcaP family trimeric outer membrane transporter n=1 Tax=Candidatus Brevundimonas colombiensis TaxID=3121376 RepID=A0AAJ5X295_9CAUL|nr:DcaP family trimeric outer membrane transporter [Brevundimonas sp.]WEK41065.1 MAG: DcaP family trimeric outer membrane transporter [Brevundimonas sp.]
MTRTTLFAGAAVVALLSAPGIASAQSSQAALEARIAQLEAELNALKGEVVAARTQQAAQAQDIIRLETRPAAAPANQGPAQQAALPTLSEGFRIGDHTVKFGGFVKVDAYASRYSGGDPVNGDALREFHIPGSIPIGGSKEDTATDFNARQTRFWLTTDGMVGGHKIGTRMEMDFQTLPGAGDQRTTSPANPALRRAFITIDNWLIGQEWTNFQNTAVLPESADFVGAAEGTVFARQVQVRYTRGPLSVSVENPETTVTPFGGGARIVADDNSLPDFTARYAVSRPWGDFQFAGLLRQLKYQNPATSIDSTTTGWGLSASTKIKVGSKDDLRLMVTGGEGIGRYVGLNFSNDAVLNASGDLDAIGVVAGFAAYRHVWAPGWRSSLIWSGQKVDNDIAFTGLAANRSAQSIHANLIWSPVTAFDVGAELMFADREIETGASGDMTRLILFAKYGF